MRSIPLTVVNGGINRLRVKGAARPDSLFDLVNGYVTVAKTVKARPGSFRAALITKATKGLTAADNKLHVFTVDPNLAGDIAGDGVTIKVHLITHPAQADVDGNAIPLTTVHFAEKFMGALYVVPEFDTAALGPDQASVYHYWLQEGGAWQADTIHNAGDIVRPTTFQGLYYQATRIDAPNPVWTANTQRVVGEKIEPTVPNGFYYTVTEALGDNPQSGTTEPVWPTQDGAEIAEDTEAEFDGLATPAPQPATNVPAQSSVDRYRGF